MTDQIIRDGVPYGDDEGGIVLVEEFFKLDYRFFEGAFYEKA
jgi:hypothetical protein